jgi:4-amino-4-deoxy-L-arabinose transferase-like glycosyltransferase
MADSLTMSRFSIQKKPYLLVLILAILINVAGIGVKYFTDDPSLYSMLARTMAQTNNFTYLIYHGGDWLDKPHFPFWIAALSFKVFGINTMAYKIPALLFFFMSVAYTYKLARKFYGAETSIIAILILLTAQHVVMSNTDVRAEPYIMGLLMGAVYHFYKVKERFSWGDIVLGALFTGCAVMTKGIYLLIPIGFAIIGDYIFKKEIKSLFTWKWLLAAVLVLLFTLPEIYTLYVQFDLHPEKVIFGHTGVSGIHWFLWDSQFGRFSNTAVIKNTHGDIFFFLHTLLWAFAPWSIVLYCCIFKSVKNIIKGVAMPEYVTVSGAFIMLLIFSISKFQLPFYTNILFPFLAIITARFVKETINSDHSRFFSITQYTIAALLIATILVLNFVFEPEGWLVFSGMLVALVLCTMYIYKSNGAGIRALFLFTCCVSVFVNAYFSFIVYPTLVKYKGDVQAAQYINQNYPNQRIIAAFEVKNAFEFYMHTPVTFMDEVQAEKQHNKLMLINEDVKTHFTQKDIPFKVIKSFDHYSNENMTLPFLIEDHRATVITRYYLVMINSRDR